MATQPILQLLEGACAIALDFMECPLSPRIRQAIEATPADGAGIGFRNVPISCEQARELLAFFECAAAAYQLKGDAAASRTSADASENARRALQVAGC